MAGEFFARWERINYLIREERFPEACELLQQQKAFAEHQFHEAQAMLDDCRGRGRRAHIKEVRRHYAATIFHTQRLLERLLSE